MYEWGNVSDCRVLSSSCHRLSLPMFYSIRKKEESQEREFVCRESAVKHFKHEPTSTTTTAGEVNGFHCVSSAHTNTDSTLL